jgi:hypothetical protein
VFGTKLVRKIVGCKYGMSKQFSILQYEDDCVAQYHYESAIYESTNDWTCGQDREGARNEAEWKHGKRKICEDSIMSAKYVC